LTLYGDGAERNNNNMRMRWNCLSGVMEIGGSTEEEKNKKKKP
jgi:hypothetical protein